MDDHLRDLDEFLRDFPGKSELTSALSTVRTAGEGDVHVHEAASAAARARFSGRAAAWLRRSSDVPGWVGLGWVRCAAVQ